LILSPRLAKSIRSMYHENGWPLTPSTRAWLDSASEGRAMDSEPMRPENPGRAVDRFERDRILTEAFRALWKLYRQGEATKNV